MGGNPSRPRCQRGRALFRQDEALIRHVLTERRPGQLPHAQSDDVELQEIADMALRAGILEKRADMRTRRPLVYPGRNPRGRHSVIRFTPRVARGCPDWRCPFGKRKNRVGERNEGSLLDLALAGARRGAQPVSTLVEEALRNNREILAAQKKVEALRQRRPARVACRTPSFRCLGLERSPVPGRD